MIQSELLLPLVSWCTRLGALKLGPSISYPKRKMQSITYIWEYRVLHLCSEKIISAGPSNLCIILVMSWKLSYLGHHSGTSCGCGVCDGGTNDLSTKSNNKCRPRIELYNLFLAGGASFLCVLTKDIAQKIHHETDI